MGCHGNHAFSHSPDRFIFRIFLGGRNEQFGTEEKCAGVQGMLNWPQSILFFNLY